MRGDCSPYRFCRQPRVCVPVGLQRQVMTLSGCISYEQCPDGSEPTTWQCTYNSTGVPVEIEELALLDALPSAKAGLCKQVLPIPWRHVSNKHVHDGSKSSSNPISLPPGLCSGNAHDSQPTKPDAQA